MSTEPLVPAASEADAAVRVRGLEKRFGGVRALRDVSFVVPRGSLYGLVGPNGAGKTTTLRVVASDLPAGEGEVWVLGSRLPEGAALVRRRLGYMPDAAGLYDELTLREYLDFFARLNGLRGRSAREASEVAIELSGTRHLDGRRLEGLSRGETQRVLLARTLIQDPDLLVLDEPAAGLDPRGRVELRELLRLLHERGKTILISSHILSDLEEICTHLALIDRGRVISKGTTASLLAREASRVRIRIEAMSGAERIRSIVGEWSDAVLVDSGRAFVEIEAPADPAWAHQRLRALLDAGVPVHSFARRSECLEDVYLDLTNKAEEDE